MHKTTGKTILTDANTTCELWLDGKQIATIKELEMLACGEDYNPFMGTVIIDKVLGYASLVIPYILVSKFNGEPWGVHKFRFVGETPGCFLLNESQEYQEQKEYPVVEGEKYEFFARKI